MGSLISKFVDPSKQRPSKWILIDLLIIGWTKKNHDDYIPTEITNVIEMMYWCFDYRFAHHIQVDRTKKYFGSSLTCWFRQIYKPKEESQYRLIPVDEARNTYQLECAYGCKNVFSRIAVVEHGGQLRLRLLEDHSLAASFELVMVDNKGAMKFVLKYVDSEEKQYVVGTQETPKHEWNMLHPVKDQDVNHENIHKILQQNEYVFCYTLEAMKPSEDLLEKIFAIYSWKSQRFMAYQQNALGECSETYTHDHSTWESAVQFERVSEQRDDLYFIKNEFNHRRAVRSGRYNLTDRTGHYLGFDEEKYVKYFSEESDRAIWRVSFVPDHDPSYPKDERVSGMLLFKAFGFYEGAEEHGGWLMARKKDSRNVLSSSESDAFVYAPLLVANYRSVQLF